MNRKTEEAQKSLLKAHLDEIESLFDNLSKNEKWELLWKVKKLGEFNCERESRKAIFNGDLARQIRDSSNI